MSEIVLVLGASGLLGHEVFLEAKKRWGLSAHGTFGHFRNEMKEWSSLHLLDVSDFHQVRRLLDELKPRAVINCAGIVKSICTDASRAVIVNGRLPHLLRELLDAWGGRLIQISTDCVFTGKRGNYTETDMPDADDLYGKTKIMGEVGQPPHLTVRTSFIGHELETERGLMAWFLKQKGDVRGFQKVIWSGVTTRFAARVLNDLLFRADVTGVLNLSGESIDKYSLLCAMADVFDKRDVHIFPVDEPAENKSLNNQKLIHAGFRVPSIRAMLSELKAPAVSIR